MARASAPEHPDSRAAGAPWLRALHSRPVKWTSWLALATLAGLIGFVVYSSLHVGAVRCEVCIGFEGREACRAVDGATEHDALMAARTNACAQIASGVTQTMACERTPAAKEDCRAQ